jgi:hypothetical protein
MHIVLVCKDCPFPMSVEAGGEHVPFPLLFGGDNPFPMSLPIKIDIYGHEPSVATQNASRIVQANLIRLATTPPGALLVAVGHFKSDGGGEAALVPHRYIVPPADGIYDFDLIAKKPSHDDESAQNLKYAFLFWPTVLPKGARIRAEDHAVVTLLEDASTTLAPSKDQDFQSWIGKKLVRSGAQPPADPREFLLEEDIPNPYRIFTPSSCGDTAFNKPNRINVYIDADLIVTAVGSG